MVCPFLLTTEQTSIGVWNEEGIREDVSSAGSDARTANREQAEERGRGRRREEANRRGYKRHGGEHSYKFIGRIEGRLHPDKGGLRECCKGSLEAENECRSPLGLVNDRRHRTDIANKGHGIPMNTIPPVFPISKLRLWIHGVG